MKMQNLDISLILIALILVGVAIYIAYQLGKKAGTTNDLSSFRRPINTFLFYNAPEQVQEELSNGITEATPIRGLTLPDTFDARQKWAGAIGTPMDQGTCGSCWAFSAASALTDRFRITEPENQELRERFRYRPFIDPPEEYVMMNELSPYELVTCDICALTGSLLPNTFEHVAGYDGQCDLGCEGGYIQHVYKYLEIYGVTSMICTPPTCDPNDPPGTDCDCERGEDCRVYKPRDVYAVFNSYDDKETRRIKIMEDIYTYGPISTGYTVYNSFYTYFQTNPTGVYREEIQPPDDLRIGGHAIVLLGWGTDPETGIFYWLARNSWGPHWADNGFFKIQYDWGDLLEPIYMAARI